VRVGEQHAATREPVEWLRFLVDAIGLNKVKGKPFSVMEIVAKIQDLLADDGRE
jgi:hypothetical protein